MAACSRSGIWQSSAISHARANLAARTVAEGIGAGVGHADDAAGLIHALGRCERLDKADLLFSRPAVVAAAELGRLERDRRRRDALGRGNGSVRGH